MTRNKPKYDLPFLKIRPLKTRSLTISTLLPPSVTHQPVLLKEVVTHLNIQPEGRYLDCTFGRGGHSRAILEQLAERGQLLALDQDPEAIEAGQKIAQQDSRFQIVHAAFSQLEQVLAQFPSPQPIMGILLDLGVSSPQLDNPDRGFSFRHQGPLDMRMNTSQGPTLQHWLNTVSLAELITVLKDYGEEPHARRIAKAIIMTRQQTPLTTTVQLADIVAQAHPAWPAHHHPATQTFQALRIFINRELEQLQQILPQIPKLLAPQGRLLCISFHSLEDRIVKRFIRQAAQGDHYPAHIPIPAAALRPTLRKITRPIYPNDEEIAANPRARSAVLRVAERI